MSIIKEGYRVLQSYRKGDVRMPLIECHELCIGYGGKPVLPELTFAVGTGDFLCIIGENGSGKSTLMKTLLNLVSPISGRIIVSDSLTPHDIGYMPQQTTTQKDFPASVREVVLSGCLNSSGLRPFFNKAEKQRAEDNMEILGISAIARHCYRELSGGQQQRVLLARALCAARRVLWMDEPAAGLDPGASADLYDVVKRLNASGVTVIMISHDIASAIRFASHIMHIGNHSVIFYGKKEAYIAMQEPAHDKQVYIGVDSAHVMDEYSALQVPVRCDW